MSKEYLNKVDDVKDSSKDNIHRLNVISEHDNEINSIHNNTIHSEGIDNTKNINTKNSPTITINKDNHSVNKENNKYDSNKKDN